MTILETHGLSYAFSRGNYVVREVNLKVPEGSIYGFLGPNGAGKTTTLKILLGLLKCQKGQVRIFQKPINKNRIEILRRTGALIETPSLYGQLTARENLEVLRKIYDLPLTKIEEALRLVGLADTGKKPAGAFSLGMKQRLGIAMALIHQPELLILDEPTNGLDPAGIVEMREMLKRLNQQRNVTILISSHLLSEIERLVSHVGVIMSGKLVYQGLLSEMLEIRRQTASVFIETSDNHKAGQIISGYIDVSIHQHRLMIKGNKDLVAKINRDLVKNGIDVYSIGHETHTLEDAFIELTTPDL